jgi:hypothetical protein
VVKVKKKQNKSQTVLVNFILDKSRSMASVVGDTIGGFNAYIDGLRKGSKVKYLFSLTLFDTTSDNRHVAVPLAELPALNETNYRPDGWTALYDAIGTTIRRVEENTAKFDKVITVVLTDGHENSSREFNLSAIRELIAKKEKEGNWTFVYLGATADAWDVGVNLGVSQANTVRYDPRRSRQMYAAVGAATMDCAIRPEAASRNIFRGAPTRKLIHAAGMSRRPSLRPRG